MDLAFSTSITSLKNGHCKWVSSRMQDTIEKGQFIFHLGDATDQLALVVKNLPANAGDARDACLIPGW